jgi:hypothetical protein
MKSFTEQIMLTEINCGNGNDDMTKAQFGVRTKIICQLFGVNESDVPRDMQKYLEYQQI